MYSTCFRLVFHPKYEYLGYINSAVRDILFQVRDKISGDRKGMFGRSAGGSVRGWGSERVEICMCL